MSEDKLLEQLFQPARSLQLADDGFTQRVVSALPRSQAHRRTVLLSRLWTAFCVLVGAVLFVLLRGWEPIFHFVYRLVSTPPTQHSLLMLTVTMVAIGLIAVSETLHRERLHAL